MQAQLANTGLAFAKGVIGTVTSTSSRTTISEGTVIFGNVAPGATAAAPDTFTIIHDRTVPFDPAVLRWTFTVLPYAPAVGPVSSPTSLSTIVLAGTAGAGDTIEVVNSDGRVEAVVNTAGVFSLNVPLVANRLNMLFVTTIDAAGRSEPVPVHVLQDAVPPSLFIDFPADGSEVTTENIVVAGRVGDMLSGFQGLSVQVNSQPGTVNVGIGNNGTFERGAVPLAVGNNTVIATPLLT